ncbi:alpha/beta fold hydrolase [Conexibacter arvalis]|uniref:Homoserine O-acetyltransferase n=1 Tax=Conexibacter arvalis TaxID=912552 RepID=A0A840IDK7_9ACTN|nr:homoserine O-acetyltransferase [Conexibacter arvalis]
MKENRYYSPSVHGPYEVAELGELPLAAGGALSDCRVAYATAGRLNEAGDNAVLFPTWFGGTHLPILNAYVGPGRALDPERHFVIVVNQLGNGLSSSPHDTAGELAGAAFPALRIADDVRAQERLLDRLGVGELQLVVGASMGAQQAYAWAAHAPQRVRRLAVIAGTAVTSPQLALLAEALADAIVSDPGYDDGRYDAPAAVRDGLLRHARLWAAIGHSSAFWSREHWRTLGFGSAAKFRTGFLDAHFTRMDPLALLRMLDKLRHADVRSGDADLAETLGAIAAPALVLAIDHDQLFPPADCAADASLLPAAELRVLESVTGHQAIFGAEASYREQVDRHLRELLAREIP